MKKTLLSGSVYVFDYTVKLQIVRLEPDHVFKCYLRIWIELNLFTFHKS
jgi:hypothetical protein